MKQQRSRGNCAYKRMSCQPLAETGQVRYAGHSKTLRRCATNTEHSAPNTSGQQKKEKPASDRVATELAGVQKEVESLKQLLAKAELAKTPSPPRRGWQRTRFFKDEKG
jgi:hypothetical protein